MKGGKKVVTKKPQGRIGAKLALRSLRSGLSGPVRRVDSGSLQGDTAHRELENSISVSRRIRWVNAEPRGLRACRGVRYRAIKNSCFLFNQREPALASHE